MTKCQNVVIYIMGVSGSGKSTIGLKLSEATGIPFFDGDDFHSAKNKNKMANGKPLTDDDRKDWLLTIHQYAKEQLQNNDCIIACSALKENYRKILSKSIETRTYWVFLNGSYAQVLDRLQQRKRHFMPTSLLQSQFDTLEVPENALTISIDQTPEDIVTVIQQEVLQKSAIGIIGLGVMGKNLSRNFASNGISISIYNRHVKGKEENVAKKIKDQYSELSIAKPFDDLTAFVNSLQRPRKILLMVKAGKAIDIVLEELIPLLSKGDIIIDGGNSHYSNTGKRIRSLAKRNIHFLGCGISGGEQGALKGPSLMPSGNKKAYGIVQPFLETIAAKDKNNNPCCTYIGKGGSGHFVKMVHNGIEYAEMQLLAELYHVYTAIGKKPIEIANIFEGWESQVQSYLLEITITILRYLKNDEHILSKILDKAGNKGTGNWATVTSAQLGIPSTLISSSLFARYISSFKKERVQLSNLYPKQSHKLQVDDTTIMQAYQLARIINHHQGFRLLKEASKAFEYNLSLSEIARIWTNGCIIRSELMEVLINIFKTSDSLLLNSKVIVDITLYKNTLNELVTKSILSEIPIPCFSDALNYLNGITSANLPANLIQAQRDFFGAHTYRRNDDNSEKFYHTNWKQT